MTQIKSKKAKDYIMNIVEPVATPDGELVFYVEMTPLQVVEAIRIAETEAEERHAKELRELKERVVKAFCFCGICKNISSQVEESESCPFIIECDDRKLFIEKLNEK